MGKDKHTSLVKLEQALREAGPCLAICADKDCARAGAKQIIRAVEEALAESGLSAAVVLTKCQDRCDDGPVLTLMPGAWPYQMLTPETARQIVLEHMRDERPVLAKLPKRLRRKLERRLARDQHAEAPEDE